MILKKLVLLIFITFNGFIFGQNCKYEINEVDKFTGKVTKITKSKKVITTFLTAGSFSMKRVDSDYFIVLNYGLSRYKKFEPYNINSGAQLILLLQNGEKITLTTPDEIKGIKKTTIGIPPVYSCYLNDVNYPVEKKSIEMLLKSKVTNIRFYRTESNGKEDYIDSELKSKAQEGIQDLIMCVYKD